MWNHRVPWDTRKVEILSYFALELQHTDLPLEVPSWAPAAAQAFDTSEKHSPMGRNANFSQNGVVTNKDHTAKITPKRKANKKGSFSSVLGQGLTPSFPSGHMFLPALF